MFCEPNIIFISTPLEFHEIIASFEQQIVSSNQQISFNFWDVNIFGFRYMGGLIL